MEYKLLNDGTAMLKDLSAVIIKEPEVSFCFEGIGEGSFTAEIKVGKIKYYRSIEEGECKFESSLLSEGSLFVTVMTDKVSTPAWRCDPLSVIRLPDNSWILIPDPEERQLLRQLRIEADKTRSEIERLKKEIIILVGRMNDEEGGYDI